MSFVAQNSTKYELSKHALKKKKKNCVKYVGVKRLKNSGFLVIIRYFGITNKFEGLLSYLYIVEQPLVCI